MRASAQDTAEQLNPYSAPSAIGHIGRIQRRTAALPLLASVGAFALTLALVMVLREALPVGLIGFTASAGLAAWGLARGVGFALGGRASGAAHAGNVLASVGSLLMTGLGALAALASTFNFSRGRQLRRFGRVLLPPVGAGASWAAESEPIALEPALGRALAAQWRENGRTEHASVAAFARLTLDLIALGAPPDLIAAANRDALDEIRHAELCFALARSLDGDEASPAAFPQAARARTLSRVRPLAFAQLAVDSLVDGALHEGVSARIIAQLARRCSEPSIAAMLRQIAADEGRHAAHGWDVVEWCLQEGGAPVEHALHGALRALPRELRSPLPEAARDGSWERWGIHGEALEHEQYQLARTHLAKRIAALTARAA